MIRILDQAEPRAELDYDVVIVGSGPAGATVARELAESALRVAVLESGARKPTAHGDRLREVESRGIQIKDYSRERVLGGASTTWAGLSSPLDSIDLGERPFVALSGWPLTAAELAREYDQAAARYRFPGAELFFAPSGFRSLAQKGELRPVWSELEAKVFLAAAQPQNFGADFPDLYAAANVDLWLDATVLNLVGERNRESPRVAALRVRSQSGRELEVRARAFVLATGGIENARLLLVSRDLCAAGLGNERDQVGRYLMNHPKNYRGTIQLSRAVKGLPYYFGCLHKGFAGYAGLRLSEALQRERRVLNAYVRFEPLFPWTDNDGVESLVLFAKKSRGLLAHWQARQRGEVIELRDYSETGDDSELQNARKSALSWVGLGGKVLLHSPSVARYLSYRLVRSRRPTIRAVRVRNFMEMEPFSENRVALSSKLDAYGQPVPFVHHEPTELDRRSLVELHRALGREVERTKVGVLTSDLERASPWPVDQDASHHMGTTRMGRDPASSVVDPHLRVHTVENVYLAGASVFPTSGCANPTMTIVALSIRLARTLRERLGAAAPRASEGRASG